MSGFAQGVIPLEREAHITEGSILASSSCLEYGGRIEEQGHVVRVSFTAQRTDHHGPDWFKAVQRAVFRLYKESRLEILEADQVHCRYVRMFEDNHEFGIQVFFRKQNFKLYVFTGLHGLPDQFRRTERELKRLEQGRIRTLLENGIIEEGVFSLYYQPIIEIDDLGTILAIKGAEAFLRIMDNGELRNPKNYLDVAESDPVLMRRLGFKILELACSDLKLFKTKYPMFTVSLNVSEQQFARFDDAISFGQIFSSIKEQYEVARHDIALEVPQISADSNSESAGILKQLFNEGTPIILDDFSLGALMKDSEVEIDKYKVSGDLVAQATSGNERQKFVARDFLQRVFAAARQYGKSVVVKGVEFLGQIPVLVELGYRSDTDLVQGNAFCPPMDLRSFEIIYKENLTRRYKFHVRDLFKRAQVKVLYQKSKMLIDICSYFRHHHYSTQISVAHSFSELWTTQDRNLVVLMGYDFESKIVSPDQLKDADHAEERWSELLEKGLLFEIPGLPMALINNFQDEEMVADLFEMVEDYDGHNLYQILIAINKEKTEKIPFVILSEQDTDMRMVEENVLILNNLDNLENFEDVFFNTVMQHPEAISKFNRF